MKSFDVLNEYVNKLNANSAVKSELKGTTSVFQFKNDLGDSFYLSFKEDGSAVLSQGEHGSPTVVLTAKEEDLQAIIDGKLDGVQAFFSGKLKIKGDPFLAQKLVNIIKKLK
ncbi:MAG: SCP2 sterol-binding domain-containing protein [Thermoplasmata archaeon]